MGANIQERQNTINQLKNRLTESKKKLNASQLKKKELENARKTLEKMRREVLNEVQDNYAASREIGQNNLPDLADVSSNAYSREMLLNLSDAQHRKLQDIDAALERMDNDEYGICASCGEDIASAVTPDIIVPHKTATVFPFRK